MHCTTINSLLVLKIDSKVPQKNKQTKKTLKHGNLHYWPQKSSSIGISIPYILLHKAKSSLILIWHLISKNISAVLYIMQKSTLKQQIPFWFIMMKHFGSLNDSQIEYGGKIFYEITMPLYHHVLLPPCLCYPPSITNALSS